MKTIAQMTPKERDDRIKKYNKQRAASEARTEAFCKNPRPLKIAKKPKVCFPEGYIASSFTVKEKRFK